MNRNRDIIEREANFFARCLLMPAEFVKDFFKKHDINEDETFGKFVKTFRVPTAQAMKRLAELGYLDSTVEGVRIDRP